ncbi:hypothetical protein IWQ53_001637 [Labrenzia sp. EL_162]|nr:hypothetical protein [Labrenzia sp. EL_162]
MISLVRDTSPKAITYDTDGECRLSAVSLSSGL